jgi:hypothetical protein
MQDTIIHISVRDRHVKKQYYKLAYQYTVMQPWSALILDKTGVGAIQSTVLQCLQDCVVWFAREGLELKLLVQDVLLHSDDGRSSTAVPTPSFKY